LDNGGSDENDSKHDQNNTGSNNHIQEPKQDNDVTDNCLSENNSNSISFMKSATMDDELRHALDFSTSYKFSPMNQSMKQETISSLTSKFVNIYYM